MTTTPHGQVPEALIDLIDAYAETRHRCGGIYNAKTEAARNAVIEALSGVQALSAAPAGFVPVAAFDRLHAHAESLAARLLAASPTPPAEQTVDPDGEAFRNAARLGLTLRFYGSCAQSSMPGTPSAYVVTQGSDRAEAMREAVEQAAAIIASGGEAPKAPLAPPAEQQATKETSGGFHVWRDISTAPKDGSRFVAIGYNYGLYSEGRHICVAQWFRGCWMETSDWNEASELQHLTHWLPLPSPPDNAAELNDLDVSVSPQQAASKAASTLPQGWTDCTIEFGNDGPEVVAYGPKRMMNRLAKWLGKYFAQVIADAAPKAAPVVWLSSKQLRGVTALHGQYLPFRCQPEGRFDTPVYLVEAAPKAAPGELHDHQILAITTAYEQGVGKGRQAHESGKEIANPYGTGYRCDLAWQYGYEEGKKQAERIAEAAPQQEAQRPWGYAWRQSPFGWGFCSKQSYEQAAGRGEEVAKLYTAPQPAPAPLSEMPYEKRKAIQEGEQISASDAWFKARHEMLDTVDRRNVFRAGFDRGWNAALAAQGGK